MDNIQIQNISTIPRSSIDNAALKQQSFKRMLYFLGMENGFHKGETSTDKVKEEGTSGSEFPIEGIILVLSS